MDSLNDMTLAQLDPEIQAVLDAELGRQREIGRASCRERV